ncbi:MAG: hypothetical protein DRH49_03555 [Candidatus Coatesbacteria bacterium]|nr:MAG: hypothetical protein DRH49_03555 [Candidatus Coatesbacteria bacterium]
MSRYTTREQIRSHLPALTMEVASDELLNEMIEEASDIVDANISSLYITPLSEPYDAIITHITTYLAITLVLSSIYTDASSTIRRLLETIGEQAYDLLDRVKDGDIPLIKAKIKGYRDLRSFRQGLTKSEKGNSQFYIPDEVKRDGGEWK